MQIYINLCKLMLLIVVFIIIFFFFQLTPAPAQQKTDSKGQATFGQPTVSATK